MATDLTGDGLGGPGVYAFTVTPHDSIDFDEIPRALYVGGAGNVAVRMRNGDQVTFVGVPAGGILPIRALRVLSTGTTATSIIGLY